MSHFLHRTPQRLYKLVEHRAAAWYNQKRDNKSDPLTLGKLKKVYFLFANCGGVVHTLHKSDELDDIKSTSSHIAL